MKNNAGYPTEANIISATFPVDSIGIKTIMIPHGLAIAPKIQDCYLTVVKNTNVTDWRYTLLIVNSVDSVNALAKIYVSTASGTLGATARLNLKVG